MSENIEHENGFDKVPVMVPKILQAAFSELSETCGDILETDHPGADFAEVEEKSREAVNGFGRALMSQAAGNRDDGARSIQRDGRSWHRLPPSRGSFHCCFGRVEYDRSRYRNSTVGKSVCPTDEGLGLLAGRMTCPVGRMAIRMLAEVPIRTAKDIFDGCFGASPAVSTWQKLSRMVDWSWRHVSEEALADIRAEEDIPEDAASVVLSLDGVFFLLRPGVIYHNKPSRNPHFLSN